MYVCNCNGIRARDVSAAIRDGASRPAQVFHHCGASAQCAKCVCEMRRMIQSAQAAQVASSLASAAEIAA